jgi:hypothetical protein
MHDGSLCGAIDRRKFLAAAAAAVPFLGETSVSAQQARSGPADVHQGGTLGVPGPYPGRVVEVRSAALKRTDRADRAAIKAALDRGLTKLTGAEHSVDAWRVFVKPGEAVGIKVVPNGYPGAHTATDLIMEVIDGLS